MARFLTLVSLVLVMLAFQWIWDALPHLQALLVVVALAAAMGSCSGCADRELPPPSGVAS